MVTTSASDSLDSLATKINDLSTKTGVSAEILQYNSMYFLHLLNVNSYNAKSVIYDYNNVLSGLFTPLPEQISSKDFTKGSALVSHADVNDGSFTINGKTITLGMTDTLDDLVATITAADAGVIASKIDHGTDEALSIVSSGVQIGDEIVIVDNDSVIINALIIPEKNLYSQKFKDYSKVVAIKVFDGSQFIDRRANYYPPLGEVSLIKWHNDENPTFNTGGIVISYDGSYTDGIKSVIKLNYALLDETLSKMGDVLQEIQRALSSVLNSSIEAQKKYEEQSDKLIELIQKSSSELGKMMDKYYKNKAAKNAIVN